MGREDWYRHKTWTLEDQKAFRTRLNRSRGAFHKAQYLRIQAYYLQQIGNDETLIAALELLEEIISQYPDEFSIGETYSQIAQCQERLGNHQQARDAYRASLAAQKALPEVRNDAYLNLAESLLYEGKEFSAEVISILNEFGGKEVFPIQIFRYNVLRAIALDELNQHAESRVAARLAIETSTKTQSEFIYHRKLGLVSNVPEQLEAHLRKLSE